MNYYKDLFAKDEYDTKYKNQISKVLRNGLTEDSYTPYAAPVTLAFKKEENTENRLLEVFRELNKIIGTQYQPFPLIEFSMEQTVGCQ